MRNCPQSTSGSSASVIVPCLRMEVLRALMSDSHHHAARLSVHHCHAVTECIFVRYCCQLNRPQSSPVFTSGSYLRAEVSACVIVPCLRLKFMHGVKVRLASLMQFTYPSIVAMRILNIKSSFSKFECYF